MDPLTLALLATLATHAPHLGATEYTGAYWDAGLIIGTAREYHAVGGPMRIRPGDMLVISAGWSGALAGAVLRGRTVRCEFYGFIDLDAECLQLAGCVTRDTCTGAVAAPPKAVIP